MPTAQPLVAICMATYEPDPALLERQIESIRAQTHANWVCVVSDDGSSGERLARLRELAGSDPRFHLSESEERLGFYLNFERALAAAPSEAELIALADQDDEWFPEKLATLVGSLGGAELVYSDMRIVDEQGQLISGTFWRGRRNNHTDLASLLLANTVTGAASLFPRGLLDLVLPFPPRLGDAFHDHWIAAVALARGAIAYVDRPLYDYVQHGEAAAGHAAAMRGWDPRRLVRWRDPGATLAAIGEHGERSYEQNLRRVALAAQTLETRLGGRMTPNKERAVRRVAALDRAGAGSAAWLALRSLRRLFGRNETMGIELSLLAAILWKRLGPGRGTP
ncbi:MAG TPA: glycosyltransferase [Solirubrobacterales bacterium]|nr:glycosyltransferase [Solirubrobacterales bacterium]